MLLRAFLVAVVSGLGCDLPNGQEFARWTQTGRAWLVEQVASLSASIGEQPRADPAAKAPVAARTPSVVAGGGVIADDEFSSVVGRMAASFAAELASVREDATSRANAFDPLEIGEDLYPGEAFALNRRAEGLAIRAAADRPTGPAGGEGPSVDSRGDRLATAVRLTGQAVRAWVSVLQQGPAVASVRP